MDQVPNEPAAETIVVSERALDLLRATKPWLRFLAVLGFIFVALIAWGSLGLLAGSARLPGQLGAVGPVFGGIELLIALVYVMPCIFLFRYASAIGRMLEGAGAGALEDALCRQRAFWRYVGVLALVFVVLEILLVVAGAIASIFGLGLSHLAGH